MAGLQLVLSGAQQMEQALASSVPTGIRQWATVEIVTDPYDTQRSISMHRYFVEA